MQQYGIRGTFELGLAKFVTDAAAQWGMQCDYLICQYFSDK